MTVADRISRRGATAETVGEWRARRAGGGPVGGRSLFEAEDLALATRELGDAYRADLGGAGLDLGPLLCTEAAAAIELVRRGIPAPTEPPALPLDSPGDIARFAATARKHPRSAEQRAKAEAAVARAETTGRVPRMNGFEMLPDPEPVEGRRRFAKRRLSKKDQAKLDAIVERAAGKEPGSFEAARAERENQEAIEALAASVDEPAPQVRKLRTREEAGTAFIPLQLYDDFLAGKLSGDGYLAWGLVSSTLESRKIHPAVKKADQFARLEGGGGVLAVFTGFSAWGAAAAKGCEGYNEGLAECHRAGWLNVERHPDNWTRVSYGRRMVAWLANRGETP